VTVPLVRKVKDVILRVAVSVPLLVRFAPLVEPLLAVALVALVLP